MSKIGVSLTATTWAEMLTDIAQVQDSADIIELRLDYLTDIKLPNQAEQILREAVATSQRPLIFTHRSGEREAVPNRTAQQVSQLLGNRLKLARDYFDFDIQANNTVGLHLYRSYQQLFQTDPQIILSYHSFNGSSREELWSSYNRLATFTPDIIKIAVQINTLAELLNLFHLLETAQTEQLTTLVIGMGELGRISRILAPAYGSWLTFATLAGRTPAAAGQFTLSEMVTSYRVPTIQRQTEIYGLLGDPVSHSLSPKMHNAAFGAANLDAVYLPIKVPAAELENFIRQFIHPQTRQMPWNFKGASITIPHKVACLTLVDEVEPLARKVGAINTLVVKDNKLFGYNTDIQGAISPLQERIKLARTKVAVLGVGGAARAVVVGLLLSGAEVTVYGRDLDKLAQFGQEFQVEALPINEIVHIQSELLINTTPVGMAGWSQSTSLLIPDAALAHCQLVYDLIYNPAETALLAQARNLGIATLNGLPMLIAQAAAQFSLWTGLVPQAQVMEQATH